MSPLDALWVSPRMFARPGPRRGPRKVPPTSRPTIERIIAGLEGGRGLDRAALRRLLLPTGSLREIATDNGWGDSFVELASILEAV